MSNVAKSLRSHGRLSATWFEYVGTGEYAFDGAARCSTTQSALDFMTAATIVSVSARIASQRSFFNRTCDTVKFLQSLPCGVVWQWSHAGDRERHCKLQKMRPDKAGRDALREV